MTALDVIRVRQLERWWFADVDALRLELFRRLFAATLLIYVAFLLQHPYEWLTDQGFRSTLYQWTIFGSEAALGLPVTAVPLFAGAFVALILASMAGVRPRWVSLLLLPFLVYIHIVDNYSSFTLNRLYIFGYAVLATAPTPRRIEQAGEVAWIQSAWPVRTIQVTLLLFYFTAGTTKLMYGDWAGHLDILWTQAQGTYRTDFAAWLLRTFPPAVFTALQLGSLSFELGAPVLFGMRRLRGAAIFIGSGFHLGIALVMKSLIYFSLQMMVFYVLFLDPRKVAWLCQRLRIRVGNET